jgi:hypothetical protein
MEWAKSFFDGYNQGLYGRTDKIFQWEDYAEQNPDAVLMAQKIINQRDCPIEIKVEKPCKEVPFKDYRIAATTIDIVSAHYWRSLPAYWLLRFAFWLGDFKVDIREEK